MDTPFDITDNKKPPLVTVKHKKLSLEFTGQLVETDIDYDSLDATKAYYDPGNGTFTLQMLPIEVNYLITVGRNTWEIIDVVLTDEGDKDDTV